MTKMTEIAQQNDSYKNNTNNTYKVLSIDLDYICEPYIELYSHLPRQFLVDKHWDVMFSNLKYNSNNFDINPDNLLYCVDVFSRALMNCSNVAFGMTHDSILYALEEKNNIELFNIDHHHDVAYNEEVEQDLIKWDVVFESNWVEYLNVHERLAS